MSYLLWVLYEDMAFFLTNHSLKQLLYSKWFFMFRQYIFYARKTGINFSIGAVTVDPMSSGYDPRPLIPYMEQLGRIIDLVYHKWSS